MFALTLHQPWASLIASGHKHCETRGWGTSYRGPLAIHAGRQVSQKKEREFLEDLLVDFRLTGLPSPWTLPRGAIVAVCELSACWRMTAATIAEQSALEQALGGWSPGRFAWCLKDIHPVVPPIPAVGSYKLWYWRR